MLQYRVTVFSEIICEKLMHLYFSNAVFVVRCKNAFAQTFVHVFFTPPIDDCEEFCIGYGV